MKFIFLLISFILLSQGSLFAQRSERGSGSFTFYYPSNISPVDAQKKAIAEAKLKLIEESFGTDIEMTNFTRAENSSGNSSVDMLSLAESHVRGEWVESATERIDKCDFDMASNMWIVKVTVVGTMRQLKRDHTGPQFTAKTLNATDMHAATEHFKSGDDLFLYFQSPVDGYLAVYLWDLNEQVHRLLPYTCTPEQKIQAKKEYIFFTTNSKYVPQHFDINQIPEFTLSCEKEKEFEMLYIVFSPHHFTIPMDSNDAIPSLNYHDFQRWYTKGKAQDDGFYVKPIQITISK